MQIPDLSTEIIVAMDENRGIGQRGHLPWNIPADRRHFREVTTACDTQGGMNAVVMGRKTWDSLPTRFRPLPGRSNIVLSSQMLYCPGMEVCGSLEAALGSLVTYCGLSKVFIIGGASVYAEALEHPSCKVVHLTRVLDTFDCDVFFPELPPDFTLEWEGPVQTGAYERRFQFTRYSRGD